MLPLLEFTAMVSDHGVGLSGPPSHAEELDHESDPTQNDPQERRPGAAALALAGVPARGSAEQRVTVGLIGAGGMGSNHLRLLAARRDVEVAYVCDVDRDRLAAAAAVVEKGSGKAPEGGEGPPPRPRRPPRRRRLDRDPRPLARARGDPGPRTRESTSTSRSRAATTSAKGG